VFQHFISFSSSIASPILIFLNDSDVNKHRLVSRIVAELISVKAHEYNPPFPDIIDDVYPTNVMWDYNFMCCAPGQPGANRPAQGGSTEPVSWT
jgi:hypothetical protein